MIKILVQKDDIYVKGHAGYADNGYDIVCASVSVMVTVTINHILALVPDALIYEQKDGYVHIHYKHSKTTDVLIQSMIWMLKDLKLQYKKYIKINEEV